MSLLNVGYVIVGVFCAVGFSVLAWRVDDRFMEKSTPQPNWGHVFFGVLTATLWPVVLGLLAAMGVVMGVMRYVTKLTTRKEVKDDG